MNAIYPEDMLPLPVRDGHAEKEYSAERRTEMDSGRVRVRRTQTRKELAISVTWKLTWEEEAYFSAFIEYSADGGAKPIDMRLGPLAPVRTYSLIDPLKRNFDEGTNTWRITGTLKYLCPAPKRQALNYLPSWPESMPWIEKRSYTSESQKRFIKGDLSPDDGPIDSRKRFKNRIEVYTAVAILDQVQYEEMQRFLSEEIADGAASFMAPFANGQGDKLVKAKFVGRPGFEPLGIAWNMSMVLMTYNPPMMSEGEYVSQGLKYNESYGFAEEMRLSQSVVRPAGDEQYAFDEAVSVRLKLPAADESYGFEESVRVGRQFTTGVANELFGFSEQVHWTINGQVPVANEGYGFGLEEVTVTRRLSTSFEESYGFEEQFATIHQAHRLAADETIIYSEEVTVSAHRRIMAETEEFGFSEMMYVKVNGQIQVEPESYGFSESGYVLGQPYYVEGYADRSYAGQITRF